MQGGLGFPFFAPSVYSYISGVNLCDIACTIDEVPDMELRNKLDQVCNRWLILSI